MRDTDDTITMATGSRLRGRVSTAVEDYVRRVTMAYADELAAVILFGSQARGDSVVDSDVDLLVLVARDSSVLREALTDAAWDVQFEYGIVVSDLIRNLDQWRQMRADGFPFYQNVHREGIILWKNPSVIMPASD